MIAAVLILLQWEQGENMWNQTVRAFFLQPHFGCLSLRVFVSSLGDTCICDCSFAFLAAACCVATLTWQPYTGNGRTDDVWSLKLVQALPHVVSIQELRSLRQLVPKIKPASSRGLRFQPHGGSVIDLLGCRIRVHFQQVNILWSLLKAASGSV